MKNKNKEFRSINVAIQNSDSRTAHITIPYNSRSEFLGFYEILAPGCFTKTLQDSRSIRILVEHDDRKLIARTNNESLRLVDTPTALEADFDIPNTTEGNDLLEMIRIGLTNGASFGMIVIRDKYDLVDGEEQRTILEARLLELSVVLSEPAYPESQVYCRSLSQALENKEVLTEEEQATVRAEIEKLQAKLPHEEEKKEDEVKKEEEAKRLEEEQKAAEEEKARQEAEAKEMNELYARLEAAEKILLNE